MNNKGSIMKGSSISCDTDLYRDNKSMFVSFVVSCITFRQIQSRLCYLSENK